jgi:hypothetical protein
MAPESTPKRYAVAEQIGCGGASFFRPLFVFEERMNAGGGGSGGVTGGSTGGGSSGPRELVQWLQEKPILPLLVIASAGAAAIAFAIYFTHQMRQIRAATEELKAGQAKRRRRRLLDPPAQSTSSSSTKKSKNEVEYDQDEEEEEVEEKDDSTLRLGKYL